MLNRNQTSRPMRDEAKALVENALRRLLAEIAAGDYRDGLKRRLSKQPAYTEALAALELTEIVGDAPKS